MSKCYEHCIEFMLSNEMLSCSLCDTPYHRTCMLSINAISKKTGDVEFWRCLTCSKAWEVLLALSNHDIMQKLEKQNEFINALRIKLEETEKQMQSIIYMKESENSIQPTIRIKEEITPCEVPAENRAEDVVVKLEVVSDESMEEDLIEMENDSNISNTIEGDQSHENESGDQFRSEIVSNSLPKIEDDQTYENENDVIRNKSASGTFLKIEDENIPDSQCDFDNSTKTESKQIALPSSSNSETAAHEGSHVCKECGASYNRRSKLIAHLKSHIPLATHVCRLCNVAFTTRLKLDNHSITHMTEKIVPGKRPQCVKCKATFSSIRTLSTHFQKYHGKHSWKKCKVREAKQICRVCKAEFSTKSDLECHLGTHDDQSLQCPICSRKFDFLNHLTNHMKAHGTNDSCSCGECNLKFSSTAALDKHKLNKCRANTFECSRCPLRFRTESDFTSHFDSHAYVEHYECETCSERFHEYDEMARHIKAMHSETTLHECRECGRKYTSESGLKTHLQIHSEKLKFQCEVCSIRLPSALQLKFHAMTHVLKNNASVCKDCGVQFENKSDLITHMALSCKNAVECEICGKKFASRSNMQKHAATHSCTARAVALPCIHCSEIFQSLQLLESHCLLHKNTKEFKCRICGFTSTKKREFARHLAYHSTLSCKFCFKFFQTKNAVESHSRICGEKMGSEVEVVD